MPQVNGMGPGRAARECVSHAAAYARHHDLRHLAQGVSATIGVFGRYFVAARGAYAILYPLGVVGLRSLVWNAGFAGLAVMAVGLLAI